MPEAGRGERTGTIKSPSAGDGAVTIPEPRETAPAGTVDARPRPVPAGPPAPPKPPRAAVTDDGPLTRRQRVTGVALEMLTAIAVISVFVASCRSILINPLDRVGQVSGMAAINFRFVLLGLAIIAATLVMERFGQPLARRYARAMACSAVAALSTSLVAGAVVFALNGTPYGILAGGSDFGWIAEWIDRYDETGSIPSHYPPLPIYLIWAATEITGDPVAIVTKPLEIAGTALFGPVAYFGWRMLLKPIWALGIGVVAMLPFIEPFKVYPHLVLVFFVPLLVKLLTVLRRSDRFSLPRAAGVGAGFGLAFAVLFLAYSGWFVWALPGAAVAFAVLAPWRTGARQVLLFAGAAIVTFLPLTWVHLTGLLAPTGGVNDEYQYFDTRVEPAFVAMWRNDSGASAGPVWPPHGELGNVGLFSVLLVAGLALALALGWRRTVVVAGVSVMAGAWILRFYLAGKMYETNRVMLYPRTTMIIVYVLLILVGFAIYYATRRIGELHRRLAPAVAADAEAPAYGGGAGTNGGAGTTNGDAPAAGNGVGGAFAGARAMVSGPAGSSAGSRRFRATVPLGLMLAPLLLLFLFAGSATADRLMPANRPGTDAICIWISHTTYLPDGTCPKWGRGQCKAPG